MDTVYIETTVISYLVADPGRDLLVAAHQQATRDWWKLRRNDFTCVCSAEVTRESEKGDPEQIARRKKIIEQLIELPLESKSLELAKLFMATGALPKKAETDAIHLAVAAAESCDFLLTWNCRHLANAQILRRLEREADCKGWKLPMVCTPLELMGEFSYEIESDT